MKRFLFFLQILAVIALSSCKSEADKNAERNAVIDSTILNFEKKLLKIQLDSIFIKNKFNGSIAVFKNGKTLYEKQDGYENFERKSNIDSSSVYAIGSLSKQFTAVLVLLQEEHGKLSTKDLVSKYLQEFRAEAFKNITIQQLLNHTSGLNDFGQNLLSRPGEEFNYSNKGYRYLGKIIEKVSGKSYDENALELFKQAGMSHTYTATTFHGSHFAGANLGTQKQNSAVQNMPIRLADEDISVPAGGILSTTHDLDKWNLALYGRKILKAQTLQKFQKRASTRKHYVLGNVGYGDGIMMNLTQPQAFFHTGYVKGSPSLNIFYPDTKTSVIILSNIADESKGKEGFFQPHAQVKKAMDIVENAVEAVRKEMMKSVTVK